MTTITKLTDAICNKDRDTTLSLLNDLLSEVVSDDEVAQEITMPSVITKLHQDLIDNLGVHNKAMLLRRRVNNRKHRAQLFVQAMINGVTLSK